MNQVSFTGNGLTILIVADYNIHHEWMAFASWYSIHKILPDADVRITLSHNNPNKSLFKWITRANVKNHKSPILKKINPEATHLFAAYTYLVNNNKLPVIIIDSNIMAIRDLHPTMLDTTIGISEDKSIFVLNEITINDLTPAIDSYFKLYNQKEAITESLKKINCQTLQGLCSQATNNDNTPFVKIENCGNYNKKNWFIKSKFPPFAYTQQFRTKEMSLNENRVLDLWQRMEKSYSFML